jgi:hypothetical protein
MKDGILYCKTVQIMQRDAVALQVHESLRVTQIFHSNNSNGNRTSKRKLCGALQTKVDVMRALTSIKFNSSGSIQCKAIIYKHFIYTGFTLKLNHLLLGGSNTMFTS